MENLAALRAAFPPECGFMHATARTRAKRPGTALTAASGHRCHLCTRLAPAAHRVLCLQAVKSNPVAAMLKLGMDNGPSS